MTQNMNALRNSANPLLVVCGPTAIGKTAYSIALAEHVAPGIEIEIVSGDALQVYRYMDIGTAKPTQEQRTKVRHHLLDLVEPTHSFSVATYQQTAKTCIADIQQRGRLPVLVGGSGLYIASVVYDYALHTKGDPDVRQRWYAYAHEHGDEALYAALCQRNTQAASRIHPHDRLRLVRALELWETQGHVQRTTDKQQQQSPYTLCMIGLTMAREKLYARIDARVEEMVHHGLEAEARALFAQIHDPTSPAYQAIGYKEWRACVAGSSTKENVIADIKRNTRRYAKRQLSWFRAMQAITWIDVTDSTQSHVHVDRMCAIMGLHF